MVFNLFWLWRWLLHRLSKRQSLSLTVLFRTTITYPGWQRLFMRGFRFRLSLRRSFLRPAADTRRKLLVAREKKPLVPRVTITQRIILHLLMKWLLASNLLLLLHNAIDYILINLLLKRILLILPYRPFLKILTPRLPASFTLTRLPRTRMLQRTRRLTRIHFLRRRKSHVRLRLLTRAYLFPYRNASLTRRIRFHFRLLLRYHLRPNLLSPHHLLRIRTLQRFLVRLIRLYLRLR